MSPKATTMLQCGNETSEKKERVVKNDEGEKKVLKLPISN
jgi:hypothetical protein